MKSIVRAHLAVIAIGITLFVGLCIFGIECDNFIDYFQVQWGNHFLGGLHQIYRFSTPFLLGCIAAGLIGLWRHASSDFTISVSMPSIFLNAAITGILTAATGHFLFRASLLLLNRFEFDLNVLAPLSLILAVLSACTWAAIRKLGTVPARKTASPDQVF